MKSLTVIFLISLSIVLLKVDGRPEGGETTQHVESTSQAPAASTTVAEAHPSTTPAAAAEPAAAAPAAAEPAAAAAAPAAPAAAAPAAPAAAGEPAKPAKKNNREGKPMEARDDEDPCYGVYRKCCDNGKCEPKPGVILPGTCVKAD